MVTAFRNFTFNNKLFLQYLLLLYQSINYLFFLGQFIVISVTSSYHGIQFAYFHQLCDFISTRSWRKPDSLSAWAETVHVRKWRFPRGKKKKSQANKFSLDCLSESMTISIKNMHCSLLWPLGSKCSSMQSIVGLKVILVSPYNDFTFPSSFSKEAAVIIKNSKSQSVWHRIILAHTSDSLILVAISTYVSDSFIAVAFLLL